MDMTLLEAIARGLEANTIITSNKKPLYQHHPFRVVSIFHLTTTLWVVLIYSSVAREASS